MYSETKSGLLVLVLFVAIIIFGVSLEVERKKPPHSIVETRHEHLVFEDEGCRVYQVRIEDKDGTRFIYVAVNPATSPRPTTAYVTCRIAH